MAKFNVAALTLSPSEVENVAQVIVEQGFINGRLSENYDIQTGIGHDQQIVFLAKMGISGKALTNCTPAEIGNLTFTEKTWTPKLIAGRFTHCANDENQLFKILKQATNVYPDFFDRTQSQELQLVIALILMSIEESVPAKAWFSDSTAAVFPGGNFTIGTDLGLFNQFEGLWKQIFADATIPRYTIAKNAGVTYALQGLATDEADTILQAVFDNADSRLKGNPNAKFYVTSEIYWNMMRTVKTKEYNGGVVLTLLDGRQSLSYYGIPIYNELVFDHVIQTYQDDGTVWHLPHRVALSVDTNMPFGTLSESDLENLRSVYDEPNNQNILDFGYFLDAKFGESYLASVAY